MSRNRKEGLRGRNSSNKAIQRTVLRWHFPSTDFGEEQGFSDSLLEYFQGDHENYVARETIQNAVDARLDYSAPVRVTFEKLSIPVAYFPGQKDLAARMKRCLEFVKGQPKAEQFFKLAIDAMKNEDISVLKVSDFNTQGLSGADNDREGNWYRLVRATGTSSPKGVAGGSFGIGKGAPIAASCLRTVFYSSINDKGGTVFQGKARLISHYGDKRDILQGVGFYGVNGYQAVRNADLIPDSFERQERGTDIFIMGYRAEEGWKEKLIRSILHNFWLAISCGDLEVAVKDGSSINISQKNLPELLEKYAAEDAKFFFDSFMNSTQKFETGLKHLGTVSLYVRKSEEYPSKIMMARKPKMLVQEKPYRVLREPYAGVFICENDRGNDLLRDLEPPAHNEWVKDRAPNGWVALREIDDFIKQSLKSMGEAITSEPQDIPGLDRYLPDSEDRDYLGEQGADFTEATASSQDDESGREVGAAKESVQAEVENIIRKGIVTNKMPGRVKSAPPEGPADGESGRPTGPEKGEEKGIRIKTSNIGFRSFFQKSKDGIEYRCFISGRADCDGAIRLIAVGDDGNYPIEIELAMDIDSGKRYEILDSMINGLFVKSGETVKLSIRLRSQEKYALGVEAYEG